MPCMCDLSSLESSAIYGWLLVGCGEAMISGLCCWLSQGSNAIH